MSHQLTWLDLCSGLSGASQPALDRGWKVIRVDIDPRFKPDIVADVRALPLRPFRVDVLWASPPCTEFSKFGMRCFYPNPPEPDLSIVQGIKRWIETAKPRAWFVENVWASRPWLNRIFGPLTNRIPGHAIWSNTLVLMPNIDAHKAPAEPGPLAAEKWRLLTNEERKRRHGSKGRPFTANKWRRERIVNGLSYVPTGHNGLSAAVAALIPYEIGEAICRAVEART